MVRSNVTKGSAIQYLLAFARRLRDRGWRRQEEINTAYNMKLMILRLLGGQGLMEAP